MKSHLSILQGFFLLCCVLTGATTARAQTASPAKPTMAPAPLPAPPPAAPPISTAPPVHPPSAAATPARPPAPAATPTAPPAPLPVVPPTRAASSENPDTIFAEAVKLFKSGDAAHALPHFVHLGQVTNSPNVQLYIGYCQQDAGHDREAHQAFALAVKLSVDMAQGKYEATRKAAEGEISKLLLRLGKLTISLAEVPAEFIVKLDGEAVDSALLGSPLVVNPGLHRIEAVAKGALPALREVTLEKGDSKTITLLFEWQGERKIEALSRAENIGPTQRNWASPQWNTLAWVASGLGVVGLGAFAISGLQARSNYNRLQTDCPGGCTDAAHTGDIHDGKTFQTMANIGLAVGIAGTVTGATLLYLGFSHGKTTPPSIALAPGLVKLSYEGRF